MTKISVRHGCCTPLRNDYPEILGQWDVVVVVVVRMTMMIGMTVEVVHYHDDCSVMNLWMRDHNFDSEHSYYSWVVTNLKVMMWMMEMVDHQPNYDVVCHCRQFHRLDHHHH